MSGSLLNKLKPEAPSPVNILTPKPPMLENEELRTSYGFAVGPFGRYPDEVQHYLHIAYRYLGLGLDENVGSIAGTVPEMVFYGMLLERGFVPTKQGFLDRSHLAFIFQSRLLGGRQPGGAVADFVLYCGGIVTAARVKSAFHAEEGHPFFVGGGKAEQDRIQLLKLRTVVDRALDVNRPEDGSPLERGPLSMMQRDMLRAMGAL